MADGREAVRLRSDQAQELVAIAIAAEASALRRGTRFDLPSDRIAALYGVSRSEGRRIADRLRLMLHRRSRAEDRCIAGLTARRRRALAAGSANPLPGETEGGGDGLA